MKIEIITPDTTIFQGECETVQLPGIDGLFQILNNHAPLISVLNKGKVKLTIDKKTDDMFFDINGGVVEVLKDKILVLSE